MKMVAEFWNIPKGLISVFYVFAFATVIIFVLGFWDKMRIWSKGMDVDHELKGMGPRRAYMAEHHQVFFSRLPACKTPFSKELYQGIDACRDHVGFHPAFFRNGRQKCKLLYVPISRWRCLALFLCCSILPASWSSSVPASGFTGNTSVNQSGWSKAPRTGFCYRFFPGHIFWVLVEGIRLAALNPPAADWSPIGFAFGGVVKALFEAKVLSALYIGIWTIHFLFAFSFIAYIPFSKYEHIFASQISAYLFGNKWKEKEIPSDWVFTEEIKRRRDERLKQ